MPSRTEKARKRRGGTPAPAPATTRAPTEAAPTRRLPPWAARAAAVLLLAVFAVQALVAARRDSVTIDEYGSMPLGLYQLHSGDIRMDPINSHLPRMLTALPLLFDRPVFDPPPGTQTWGFGEYFMRANAARYQELYVEVRTVTVLLSLAAALVMAKWALDLYGEGAAVAALALFAFSPSLLAHGHLVTLDMAGTLGFLIALYANWRLLESPATGRAVWLGIALGLAALLKLSGVALAAMVLATWLIRVAEDLRARKHRRAAAAGQGTLSPGAWVRLLLVAGACALVVINVGYGFDGTFALLREGTLAPGGHLARLAAAAPWLRLPLPLPLVNGIDMVLEVGKGHEPSYFLAGELSADGWWYYHLAAFASKCPLPVLFSALFATAAWIGGKSRGSRDYAVFVPVLLLFAANSAFNSLDIGERHVLAAYPIFFVGISPWLSSALEAAPWLRDAKTAWRAWAGFAAAVVVFAWTVAGTLAVAPRYLQYFNERAGGPEGGHHMLIDSNLDWGQDLLRLREYMDANHIDTVALAYFGRVHPAVYGIRFTPLERGVSHGKAVVSASFLMGRPYFWYLGGGMRWVPAHTYEWLQAEKPVARVGSMFVYDLP